MIRAYRSVTIPGDVNAAPNVKVQIDGQYVSFPDQKPYIDGNNRTMVPMRAPMEAMGCKVDWNADTRQATIQKGDVTAAFTIGKNTYAVNGASKTMDTKAVITNNRTAFPIRFAAEAIGATVGWDAETYTVLITTNKTPAVQTVEGVKYTPPLMEGYVTRLYVTQQTPEKIQNACDVFASVTGEAAVAAEMETYILECYNNGSKAYKLQQKSIPIITSWRS